MASTLAFQRAQNEFQTLARETLDALKAGQAGL